MHEIDDDVARASLDRYLTNVSCGQDYFLSCDDIDTYITLMFVGTR